MLNDLGGGAKQPGDHRATRGWSIPIKRRAELAAVRILREKRVDARRILVFDTPQFDAGSRLHVEEVASVGRRHAGPRPESFHCRRETGPAPSNIRWCVGAKRR